MRVVGRLRSGRCHCLCRLMSSTKYDQYLYHSTPLENFNRYKSAFRFSSRTQFHGGRSQAHIQSIEMRPTGHTVASAANDTVNNFLIVVGTKWMERILSPWAPKVPG